MNFKVTRGQLHWGNRLQDLSVHCNMPGWLDLGHPYCIVVLTGGIAKPVKAGWLLSRRITLMAFIYQVFILHGQAGSSHYDPRDYSLSCDPLPVQLNQGYRVLLTWIPGQELFYISSGALTAILRRIRGADLADATSKTKLWKFGKNLLKVKIKLNRNAIACVGRIACGQRKSGGTRRDRNSRSNRESKFSSLLTRT